jgi:hypothetical protein
MTPQRIARRVNRWIERAVPWLAAFAIAYGLSAVGQALGTNMEVIYYG